MSRRAPREQALSEATPFEAPPPEAAVSATMPYAMTRRASVERCARAVADVHARPDAASERVSQCLFGERVDVLERAASWCRIRNRRDDYAGYLRADALDGTPPTPPAGTAREGWRRTERADGVPSGTTAHVVGARATLLFVEPDLKSPVRLRVPFGAELTLADAIGQGGQGGQGGRDGAAGDEDGAVDARFACAKIGRDGTEDAWVWRDHCLAPGATLDGTVVAVARRLYDGAPYLWGGRTPDGTDCSGLVQGAAFALGLRLPRDSGDQERFLEHVVPFAARTASDAVFWSGHVGLLVDPDTLFHATAHTLATAVEPLADVVRRAGPPSSVRRLPPPDG